MAPRKTAMAKAPAKSTAPAPKTSTASKKATQPIKAPIESSKAAPRATKRKAEDDAPAVTASKKAKASTAAAPKKAPVEKTQAAPKTTKRKREEDTPAAAASKKAKPDTTSNASKNATTKRTAAKKAQAAEPTPEPVPAPAEATEEPAKTTKSPRTAKVDAVPAKKKVLSKGPVINAAPTEKLDVYVFGEGGNGELGTGTAIIAKPIRRPRLNAYLSKDTVGVVQVVCGGMHAIALTHDNKILTWGVNDIGALGRDTTWSGGTKSMDADDDSESEDSESPNGLNPFESVPTEVDWSQTELAEGTRFTCVAAADNCSFAVTDDGKVYGWGTFRDKEGIFGFTEPGNIIRRPILIPVLKNITTVTCGANMAFAISKTGATFSWGCGEADELGRRLIARTPAGRTTLIPRPFGLPTGWKGTRSIHAGDNHAFAISKTGDVWSWGLNNFGQTCHLFGIDAKEDEPNTISPPQLVTDLKGMDIIDIAAGRFHSIAATKSGECVSWGRLDAAQLGIDESELAKLSPDAMKMDNRGKPRIILIPQKVTAIDAKVIQVAASGDASLAITEEGEAFSWGFNDTYQTGQGETEGDIPEATLIDNSAVRGKKLIMAGCGAQFSILLGV